MKFKVCRSCGRDLPLFQFHKCSRSRDGLNAVCKECRQIYSRSEYLRYGARIRKYCREHAEERKVNSRRFYEANVEKHKESVAKWLRENKKLAREISERYRLTPRGLLRRRAQAAVAVAKKKGLLVAPDRCSKCGKVGPVDFHHHSYFCKDWYDGTYLCRQCHKLEHKLHPPVYPRFPDRERIYNKKGAE